jgi:O-antigen/teichoic acid export membrane protein
MGLVLLAALVPSAATAWSAASLNAAFVRWEHGTELIRWGAALIVAGALEQVVLEFLRSQQRIVEFSLFQLSQTCLIVLATLLLLPKGYGLVVLLEVAVAIKLATVATVFLGLWAWNRPSGSEVAWESTLISRMIRFGLPVAVSGLGLWMMNVGDRLVIGHYLAPAALGRYGAVYTFASLLIALNGPLNLPLYPRLMSAVSSGNAPAVSLCIRTFHRYATLVLVPAGFLLVALTNPLLTLMGGEGVRVSVLLVAMIVAAVFLDQWNAIAQYSLLCIDQVGFVRNAWLALGTVNVVANILVVPVLGLVGAGLVSLVTFVALEAAIFRKACTFYPLTREYRFDVAIKAGISALLATGGLLLLGRLLPPSLKTLLASVGVFGSVYAVVLVLFRELGPSEMRLAARALGLRSAVRGT